jgi:septum formation topological specificity factor MinE
MCRAINLDKNINMEHEILDLIDRYWKFDNDQTPVSNWHDKQDLLDAVRKALHIHDVVG